MEYTESIIKSRKLKLSLLIIFLFLCIFAFFSMMFIGFYTALNFILVIGLFGLLTSLYLASKNYNWSVISFLVVLFGLVFKTQHWPFAGVLLFMGTVLLGIISLLNSVKFQIVFRNNPFLKWVGFITGIIVTFFMTGLLFGFQHWSGNIRDILGYSGCFLFILTILAIVFTLPNSNYISWSGLERKVFFRTILAPMIFIFALITLIFVFTDTFNSITGRGQIVPPWYVWNIDLFKLEGVPVI